MKPGPAGSFATHLKALREAAGFTQEELATIAGLSVHAVSALERGERRRPHVETVRALSAALDLTGPAREALVGSSRAPVQHAAVDELTDAELPLAPTSLLGREADVETLGRWLADPAVRLVTLLGPGGVGKTRLSLELARTMAEEGAARVMFVSLAAIRDSSFVAPAIAEAFGLSEVSAVDLPRRARVACDDRPTLLVLDNFEQLLDAASLVADLLTSVGVLRVLVTSRAPLRVRGEREFVVGPLALKAEMDSTSPADLANSPAVRLFVERARDVHPDFRVTPANGPTVAAICRRLDALPLALELAASWMKALTAEDLLQRLSQDALLPAPGPRDLPERQQTMTATVAWSYQLLPASERRVFRRLGALPGRFPIEAAAAVLAGRGGVSSAGASVDPVHDDALGAVAGLIDKSLVLRADGSAASHPLYRMLETVRAYAAVELVAAGESEDALDGLVGYCTREAPRAMDGMMGPAQVEWLDRVRDDLESYRVVLARLIEQGRPGEAADIAWRLVFFWLIRWHAAEGLRWYEQILNLPNLVPAAESRALVGSAAMLYTQAEIPRARASLIRALRLANDAGDTEVAVYAELVLAHVEHAAGNEDAARDRFVRSVEGFRRLAVPWGVANGVGGIAAVALATGDDVEAERRLDEAASLRDAVGPWFSSVALRVRAMLLVQRGRPDEAIAIIRGILGEIRKLQDKFAFVNALVPLAAAAVLKGDDAWAARVLGARDAVSERTGAAIVDKSVQKLRERTEEGARARLGSEKWARAYTAGRSASIDSLIREIDRTR
jgi:predicted ATPase/DNA-binding XRE family transcriptional regulator